MRTVIFGTIWLVSQSVGATPLQANLGSTISDLEKQGITLNSQEPSYEYLMVVPDQKPEDTVRALITPEHGLCEMRWSISIDPISPSGIELKTKYLELYKTLIEEAGKPTYKDAPEDPALDDQLWRLLFLQERILTTAWEKPMNSTDVTALKLEALSDRPNHGIVRLSLSAPWIDDCLSEQSRGTKNR